MDGYHRTNSAPAGPSHAALRLEPYERTYSACGPLDLQWSSGESTLNDYAIARALEEERGPPPEDTSMDHALAVALYNEQVDEICELQHYEEMRTAAANPAAPLTCSSNLVAGGQEPEIWEDGGASTSLLGRLKNWSILQVLLSPAGSSTTAHRAIAAGMAAAQHALPVNVNLLWCWSSHQCPRTCQMANPLCVFSGQRIAVCVVPLQLIPRLNCGAAPSPQHVSKDRERLLLRLDFYGLREHQVQGDGACQVCACGDGGAAVTPVGLLWVLQSSQQWCGSSCGA
jgi:hypothetical protein